MPPVVNGENLTFCGQRVVFVVCCVCCCCFFLIYVCLFVADFCLPLRFRLLAVDKVAQVDQFWEWSASFFLEGGRKGDSKASVKL